MQITQEQTCSINLLPYQDKVSSDFASTVLNINKIFNNVPKHPGEKHEIKDINITVKEIKSSLIEQ